MNEIQGNYIRTWLYHVSGAKVEIARQLTTEEVGEARAVLEAYLADGWLANAPGVVAGEHREVATAAVRGATAEDVTFFWLYIDSDRLMHPLLKHYINNEQDRQAFEAITGHKVASFTVFDGRDAIERTDKRFPRYAKTFPAAPFVWRDNPKHNPNETDLKLMKPSRLFTRWLNVTGGSDAINAQNAPAGSTAAPEGDPENVQITSVMLHDNGDGKRIVLVKSDQGDFALYSREPFRMALGEKVVAGWTKFDLPYVFTPPIMGDVTWGVNKRGERVCKALELDAEYAGTVGPTDDLAAAFPKDEEVQF